MAGTVGELVEVPRVRTVIQLADRRDPALREELLESFVLTTETTFNLVAILSAVSTMKGRGFFLQGHFGSGKSHFLAVLSFLLESPEAWQHLPVEGTALAPISMNVAGRRFLPVPVSLVEHSARERLEEIVLDALNEELTARGQSPLPTPRFPSEYAATVRERHSESLERFAREAGLESPSAIFEPGHENELERFLASVEFPFRSRYDRREAFAALVPRLEAAGFAGAVLLIDELSEYLRSKTDARGFNEEIRFLQFLGEYGEKRPFWVVATLQERIEDTGEITQSAFNKIKDRYPGRLALTGKHLEDLIARRLLPKKPAAASRLPEIYERHRRAFSGFDPGQARFEALYPVHPATLFLLEELKNLFSQHRGVVDFITARVGGDPRRKIAGMLAEPDTALLAPDAIFDHFQTRIKEMVETNPFLEIVYHYFETEAPRLFRDLSEAAAALRLVKLIILGAISPVRREFTVTELAEMMLYQVSGLASEVNYQYVADILERLRGAGAYIVVQKGAGQFQDRYGIDLEADVNLVIRRRVSYIRSTLFPDDKRLYTRLLEHVNPPHLPLASLAQASRRRVQVMWQSTRREGYLLFSSTDELTADRLEAMDLDLANSEADFVFVVSPPGVAARMPASASIALWEPDRVGAADQEELAVVLSKALLAEEVAAQTGTLAERVKKQLAVELESDKRRVREIFEKAYFTGKIHFPGGKAAEPSRWGYIPLEQTTERAASAVLEHRFPGHLAIAPQTNAFIRDREGDLIDGFFRPGELDVTQPGARALQVLVEGYLRPLGLAKKSGSKLALTVDSRRSEAARAVLDRVPEGSRTELAGLYRALRKGPMGIGRDQFRMLLLALVFSGQVTLYAEGKRLAPDKLTAFWIERATEMSRGDLVAPHVRALLAEVPFLSVARKAGEQFNVGVQQAAWEELVAYKRAAVERLLNLEAALAKALALPSMAELGLGRAREHLDAWRKLLDAVPVSYGAQEGLERFAAHWGQTPGLWDSVARLDRLASFFADGGPERFVSVAAYVRHPGLVLSERSEHQSANDALRALRHSLEDRELPFRDGAVAELTGACERFLAAYGPLYAAHHEREHSAGRYEPLRRLKASRDYALLARLTASLGQEFSDEFPRLQRVLAQHLARMCQQFDPVALKLAPVCRCGLTLGAEVDLPDAAALGAAFESAVQDVSRSLASGRMREAIVAYASGLDQAGRPEQAALLRGFLEGDSSSEKLERLLATGAGKLLREALTGRLTLVARDLDELVESLVDRSFEPAALMAEVQRWLGEVPSGGLVRVRSGRAGKEDELVAVTGNAFPELSPVLRELGEERFVELVFTAYWLEQLGLNESALEEGAAFAAPARGLARHLLELHGDLAAALLENLEARLVADGSADRLVALALGGRDREHLLRLLDAGEVFRFVPRQAAALFVRHLASEEKEALERLLEAPAGGPFRAGAAAAARVELAIRECERATRRNLDPAGWEALHRDALAGAELALQDARAALRAIECEEPLPEERLRAVAKKLDAQFRELYASRYEQLLQPGAGHPATLADLGAEVLPKFSKRLNAAGVVCIVVDAMRQDFFDYLDRELLPLAQGTFRRVETLTVWAFAPTMTGPNLEAILTGRRPASEGSPRDAEVLAPPAGRVALEEFQERAMAPVVKYNSLDDRIHTSREELRTLYREAAMALAPAMLPYLDRLPARTMIVFTADHGFRERPGFSPRSRHEQPRYTHGGISPHEVLVPVGVYLKV